MQVDLPVLVSFYYLQFNFSKTFQYVVVSPYPGLTKGGSLIGLGGGGDARHRRSVDLEGFGGMLLQNFFL